MTSEFLHYGLIFYIFFQIVVDSFVNSLQLWPYWFHLTSISCIILMQKKLSILLLSILCFFTARACRCSLAFPCLASPVSHLVWILLCTYCVCCSDCELHFSRPAVCLQVAGGHPLGFLANSMAQKTAGIQCSRPPSYFPQVLNGLLGTAEVIHKKWYMKIKAQNFNAPQRSGSFSWAKMHSQEAALKQTRRVMTLASSLVLCTCGLSLMSLIVGCNLDWTHCITVVYTHH